MNWVQIHQESGNYLEQARIYWESTEYSLRGYRHSTENLLRIYWELKVITNILGFNYVPLNINNNYYLINKYSLNIMSSISEF